MKICSVGHAIPAAFLIALFVLLASQAEAQSSSADRARVEQLWHDALQAQQGQQYDKALALYRQILSISPDLIEAEMNLGLMYQVKGDLPSAISCFKLVLKKSPDLYPPNLLAGLDYLKQGNPESSLPYLQKAVTVKPDDAKAQAGIANSNLQLQRYSIALEHFRKAVALDSKNADAWYGLGATYLSLEKDAESSMRHSRNAYRTLLMAESEMQQEPHDRSADLFHAALAQLPEMVCGHSLLGFAYLNNHQVSAAEREFQTDWKDSTKAGCLLGKLGMAAAAAQRNEARMAIDQLREAVGIDAAAVRAASDLFVPSFEQREFAPAARQIVEQGAPAAAYDRLHTSPESLLNAGRYSACADTLDRHLDSLTPKQAKLLAECSYYAGQDPLVLHATNLLLRNAPGDPEALYWRIRSLGRLGLVSLLTATQINPDSLSLHMMFANMLRTKQSFSEAAEEYRKAIALNATFLPAHFGLAQDLFLNNQREEAETEVQTVLKADPADPEANYLMGEILIARREFNRALPFLSAASGVAPDRRPDVHAALSKVYEEEGEQLRAISELRQALVADQDGSYHYRLARLLEKTGDHSAASKALAQSRQLRAQSNLPTLEQSQ
jgi:tetratricopeptide (TPR) repeat protein